MAVLDPYATGKANLRDNVKTLIALFSGVAGVLLAGTPFSGYGGLDAFSLRWWVATATLLVAIALFGLGVRKLLKVLRPDLAYPEALRDKATKPPKLSPSDSKEYDYLRAEWIAHHTEILPNGTKTIEKLEHDADLAYDLQARTNTEADRKKWEDLYDTQSRVNHWAAFTRLHYRVTRGIDVVLWWGLLALICIGIFAWAVGREGDAAPTVVVINKIGPPPPIDPPLPAVNPIRFDTNLWELSSEALITINSARNHLRAHPEWALLVFAYTDTQGGPKVNRTLSAKRADEVVRALTSEGGITRARIFVAMLPETDLPVVTAQEVDSEANRTVQLLLFKMPQRK